MDVTLFWRSIIFTHGKTRPRRAGTLSHPLDRAAGDVTVTYERELLDWNQKFNLTAIKDTESIRIKHFLDSFSCVMAWGANPPIISWMLGRVQVFRDCPSRFYIQPCAPHWSNRSARSHVLRTYRSNAWVGKRAGDKSPRREVGQKPEHREKYDCAVARAVAGMNVLSEYLLPLCAWAGPCWLKKAKAALRSSVR